VRYLPEETYSDAVPDWTSACQIIKGLPGLLVVRELKKCLSVKIRKAFQLKSYDCD
jgi:hypothetical protein